jgi:hypothetical protein
MPTLGSPAKYFTKAVEGFTTTLFSTATYGDATVFLNGSTGYTNGDFIALVVEPGTANQNVFFGTINTSTNQVTGCIWSEGTSHAHLTGAAVASYTTATDWDLLQAGILKSLNQDGSLQATAVQNALGIGAGALNGWNVLGYTPSTITYNGNRSYSCVYNAVDLTSTLSIGMRLRHTRTVASPTQSTSLNGTTTWWSKTTPAGTIGTATDDLTFSAWVKLSSYPTANGGIIGKWSGTNGFLFYLTTNGLVNIGGWNAGAGNSRIVQSYQSLPLNKWVHISGSLDMSGWTTATNKIMIDGVDVPVSLTSNGTNPTAFVQGGNLEIGSYNGGGNIFPGKIAQAAVFNGNVSTITQATIRGYMSQGLTGSETNCIGAWSFSGNSNDLTANANTLTANGSATATNADSPFGTQADGTISSTLDYAIITGTSFSTNTTLTLQVPEGCSIPTTGGLTAVVYSSVAEPYGFANLSRFSINAIDSAGTTALALANTIYSAGIPVPIDNVKFGSQSGTAGGSCSLSQVGLTRTVTGVTNTCSALASNASVSLTVNFPITFGSVPMITTAAYGHSVDIRVEVMVASANATSINLTYVSLAAAANALCACMYTAIGV